MKLSNINYPDYYVPYAKLIVMDIDDTISFADTYSDPEIYSEARPNEPILETMRKLDKEGYSFILFTSRGMISCNGDIEQADNKYRKQIETWLAKYEVPYKELIFGKPYGILYVDDKAMTPDKFIETFRQEA